MTGFRILWGWADLLAVPIALSLQRQDDWERTGFAVHIGPVFVAFEWRAA